MSLLNRWKGKFGNGRFRRFSDSFTLTRSNQLATLCEWIVDQSRLGKRVLVLTHFASSFQETQSAMQMAGIEFQILDRGVTESELPAQLENSPGHIVLTMVPMLQSADASFAPVTVRPVKTVGRNPPVSVMITERYPMIENDERLEQFLRQVPSPVSLGYLISFDDPIVRHLLGDRFIELMKQLGLGDNDLVSSAMTHRGFSRRLRKASSQVEEEKRADSPRDWLRFNLE